MARRPAHERQVARRISGNRLLPGNGIAMTPLDEIEGFVTPNGLHFERHHNGVPQIDPALHRLLIAGRVRQPLSFGVDDLLRYPLRSHLGFIECGGNSNAGWHAEPIQRPAGSVHGLVSCSEWTGVPLATLLAEAGVDDAARWGIAEGADAFAMNVSLPLHKLRRRLHRRAVPERRADPARERLPAAADRARLGRRAERQVAAPDRAGRAAGNGAQRDRQVHRAAARRPGAPVHLG